ncbi:MAG: hypothetical protein N2Z21_07220, partial [Candidatus Sumerlaeaceae bacterium]|nr:hypothetical protein [Candidatus Sumerlaeaceae bacterium]
MAQPTGQLLYREVQFFAPWVYLVLTGGLVGTSIASVVTPSHPPGVTLVGVVIPACVALLFLRMRLEIEVRASGLYVRLVPFPWKRIELATYQCHKVVTYRPIAEYGG